MSVLTAPMRSILGEGRQAYVAVVASHGPHVTPELYAPSGDELWFAVAATTLKARAIPGDDRVAALVRAGGRAVLVRGHAVVYDARHPRDLARALTDTRVPRALQSFVLRNAGDLAAFARDTVTGRLGLRLPPRRVLVRLRPDRATLVDDAGDAVVGWLTDDGPVALPARRDGDRATVPAAAVAGLPCEAPACLVTDDYGEPGPAAKSGTLRRGTGRIDADGTVTIDVAKVTTWDGVETATQRA